MYEGYEKTDNQTVSVSIGDIHLHNSKTDATDIEVLGDVLMDIFTGRLKFKGTW